MSNQQDQEKASDAKADVDLTAAGRGVWLVKVSNIFLPTYMRMAQFSVVSTNRWRCFSKNDINLLLRILLNNLPIQLSD